MIAGSRLAGKLAVVTGAHQGIGAAIVEMFVSEGATVIACDVQADEAGSEQVLPRVIDVSSADDWRRLSLETRAQFGRVDVLVNNAGIVGSYDNVEHIGLDIWDRVIAVNLTGSFLGARFTIPLMRSAGGGSIVNVSSMWGIIGADGVAAYQASKGGVRTLTKNLAVSYGPEAIRANSIHPGVVDTPLVRAQSVELTEALIAETPLRRIATAREIAYVALFLASEESAFLTGSELVVDGGYSIR
jgi:NAD(P)-dependent dehydrogenase (short-subunit alcohol dehydrogenase family)